MTEPDVPLTLAGIAEEFERYVACDHDWQPVVTETGWLRWHPHQRCTKCKSVKMKRLPKVPEDDEDQDPVRHHP